MLPKVLPESQVQVFKFWFNGALQDGTHHYNELYYRALTVEAEKRTRLYHLACRFSEQQAGALVSVADNQCSLWISLRSQMMAAQLLQQRVRGLPRPRL
ncbi:MAG: hypothetical protein DCF21_06640 [Leptolyngbya sp.]|jgi:hypothetical protein|uniref:Uncharacterized protein n=1 Tax=Shackletoniella antarctica TaxID=268115 RepID=A0A2W4Y193_9CYAN|nr:MAG: hypothetical protein DCF17_10880 [Shackletoniella antarctica]PZV19833.1 MAG: hypothetical protein DCF21_06640 [Leptolyngbya sp.]